MGSPAPVLRDVVEEHLEELAFLSIQRRKMIFSPEIGMRGVRGIDARCAAHRDALEIAGPVAVEIAEARLDERDPWQHAAAAGVWIEDGRPDAGAIAARIESAPDDALPSWREALRRGRTATVRSLVASGGGEGSDRLRALVVDACGWHREPLPLPVDALAGSAAPEVRAATARALADRPPAAAARAGRVVEDLLVDPDPRVARVAAWSLALRDPRAAAERCRRRLDGGNAEPFDLQTLGLVGEAGDVDRVLPWIAPAATRTAAIRALGHLGSTAPIEILLRLLESDELDTALAAGDAVETILGVLPPPPRRRSPRERDAGPLPPRAAWAREQWMRRAGLMDPARRWHRGRPFPAGAGDPEAPMECVWRSGIGGSDPALAWTRHEVWDGFFEAAPTHEARPGE